MLLCNVVENINFINLPDAAFLKNPFDLSKETNSRRSAGLASKSGNLNGLSFRRRTLRTNLKRESHLTVGNLTRFRSCLCYADRPLSVSLDLGQFWPLTFTRVFSSGIHSRRLRCTWKALFVESSQIRRVSASGDFKLLCFVNIRYQNSKFHAPFLNIFRFKGTDWELQMCNVLCRGKVIIWRFVCEQISINEQEHMEWPNFRCAGKQTDQSEKLQVAKVVNARQKGKGKHEMRSSSPALNQDKNSSCPTNVQYTVSKRYS